MKAREFVLLFCVAVLALAGGCDALKDAADKVIESEAGCTEEQLGNLDEPELPNCSKAVACCKFIKGECGTITLFTPPQEAIEACNANEAVLKQVIEEYQGITEDSCPSYLTEDSCQEGLEKTKENYRKAIDMGDVTVGGKNAPSCQLIVDETVNKLNEKLGESSSLLPAACEPVAVQLPENGEEDAVGADDVESADQ